MGRVVNVRLAADRLAIAQLLAPVLALVGASMSSLVHVRTGSR
jgi:hypothetical protein